MQVLYYDPKRIKIRPYTYIPVTSGNKNFAWDQGWSKGQTNLAAAQGTKIALE